MPKGRCGMTLRESVFVMCVCVLSRVWLCKPMDYSLPGSSVHGIFQARILEWVAMPSSRGSSWPRNQTHVSCVSCIGRWVLYHPRSPTLVKVGTNTVAVSSLAHKRHRAGGETGEVGLLPALPTRLPSIMLPHWREVLENTQHHQWGIPAWTIQPELNQTSRSNY